MNAIFRKDKGGRIHFKLIVKDNEYKEAKIGYNSMHTGDSGSPIWTKSYLPEPSGNDNKLSYNPNSKEERNTIIGVFSRGLAFTGIETMGARDKCNDLGTKLTPDIIQWIKKYGQ